MCSDSFLTCALLLLLFLCKFDGDHWRLGVSPEGFELALKLLKWDEYVRDESATSPFRDQSSGTMWNSGDKNGWDLCHLMRLYMERIGKTHLSFAEAVMEGEVEELVPLRREVGVADAVSGDESSGVCLFLSMVADCAFLLSRWFARIAVLLARAEGGSGGDVGGYEGGNQTACAGASGRQGGDEEAAAGGAGEAVREVLARRR